MMGDLSVTLGHIRCHDRTIYYDSHGCGLAAGRNSGLTIQSRFVVSADRAME
jgi:hypothetical protein